MCEDLDLVPWPRRLSFVDISQPQKAVAAWLRTSFLLVVLVSGMLCTFFALQFQYGSLLFEATGWSNAWHDAYLDSIQLRL